MNTLYTVYKITNKVTDKIYIGVHKTKDIDDGYMGSGKYLTYSQNKHGIENFQKEVLFVYDNPEEMYAKEAEIVDIQFVAEKNTYNLKMGGHGGFDYINNNEELRIAKNRKAMAAAKSSNFDESCREAHDAKFNARKKIYAENLKYCGNCDTVLPYEKRTYKYCGHSCARKTTNKTRVLKRNL